MFMAAFQSQKAEPLDQQQRGFHWDLLGEQACTYKLFTESGLYRSRLTGEVGAP